MASERAERDAGPLRHECEFGARGQQDAPLPPRPQSGNGPDQHALAGTRFTAEQHPLPRCHRDVSVVDDHPPIAMCDREGRIPGIADRHSD